VLDRVVGAAVTIYFLQFYLKLLLFFFFFLRILFAEVVDVVTFFRPNAAFAFAMLASIRLILAHQNLSSSFLSSSRYFSTADFIVLTSELEML
jgi:hypothetical protein